MTASLPPPHIYAIAVIFCVQPPHGRTAHWEIEWRGPQGTGRAQRWYPSYAAARAMAESCGPSEIVDE